MTTKKTTTKKTAKKTAEKEHFIRIDFTEKGIGLSATNISRMNYIEAILVLMMSLAENNPDMSCCRHALSAIQNDRESVTNAGACIEQLTHLRDVLKKAGDKARAEVAKAKSSKKTTTKKK